MKVAVYLSDAVGHLNPALALSRELLTRGHQLRFYLNSPHNEDNVRNMVAKASGVSGEAADIARFKEHELNFAEAVPAFEDQDPTDQAVNDYVLFLAKSQFLQVGAFLADVEAFAPQLILYDPAFVNPPLAAYLLGCPCASMVTYPSMNHIVNFTADKTHEGKAKVLAALRMSKTMRHYRNLYLDMYSFDLFANFVQPYSYLPCGLQICTGIREFELEMPPAVREIYGKMDRDCLYVGPMLLSKDQGRVASQNVGKTCERQPIDAPFPHREVAAHKAEGKKIVYVSFGTVATGLLWHYSGPESKMMGAQGSGRDFCRTLWRRIFEAFEGRRDYVVVMATVSEDPKALEGLDIPKNFIVRRRCPQLDVLKVADVFITHGGANSMMESITAGVPMLVLPYFGDQYDNAKLVNREGMGLHLDDPLSSSSAACLRLDVETILIIREFMAGNCARLHRSLRNAGGAKKAAERIESYVANFRGHPAKKGPNARTAAALRADPDQLNFLFQRCTTEEIGCAGGSGRSMGSI